MDYFSTAIIFIAGCLIAYQYGRLVQLKEDINFIEEWYKENDSV